MEIVLHVVIALSSIVYGVFVMFAPSRFKLRVSYGLIALTLLSGTYLALSKPAHMLEACTLGMVYLALVIFVSVSANNKLALQHVDVSTRR